MDKFILFLCGGKWQLPWFKFLKSKGHKIILVDPYKTSPCVQLADVFYKEDVKNVDAIYDFVLKNKYSISLVTSEQTDVSTLPVAILSKKLGTKANPPEVVERFTNKYLSRSFIKSKFDSHFPKFIAARSAQEVQDFMIDLKADIIIKPVDAQSSRGIFKLGAESSYVEIENAFHKSISFSSNNLIIAEEFIVGEEVTLEGFCFQNKHVTLTGSNKTHFRTGIASNLNYPLNLSADFSCSLITFHNQLVSTLGLDFGITHTEYLIDQKSNNFWIVEIACRGGGSLIPSHIVPWVSTLSLYENYYNLLFDTNFNIDLKQGDVKNEKFAKLHFFEFETGIVKSISGLAECIQMPEVIDIGLEFTVGDKIFPADDDRSRQGYVIVATNTEEEINLGIKKIYSTLKIEYAVNV